MRNLLGANDFINVTNRDYDGAFLYFRNGLRQTVTEGDLVKSVDEWWAWTTNWQRANRTLIENIVRERLAVEVSKK